MTNSEIIKINIGCGGRPLKDYVNIDMDTLDQLRLRYPSKIFDDNIIIEQFDIFNLPYKDNSVDEILCEALIEHLPFKKEESFFYEMARILKPGGKLYLSTPDFEKAVSQWLKADDDWKDFYRNDEKSISKNHWFGTYTYEPINRWGYLTATLFGSQNGEGQFHLNCYTEKKLKKIFERIKLKIVKIDNFRWKGDRDYMLGINATK